MSKQDFGELVRYIRTTQNMTLSKVEELTNVTTRHIHRIETGESIPSHSTLQALSEGFGINLSSYLYANMNFGSFSEYQKYCILKEDIYNNNTDKIKEFLSYYPDEILVNLPLGDFKRTIVAAKVKILVCEKSAPAKRLRFLFSAIEDSERSFDFDNIHKYISTDLSISIMFLLECTYFELGKYDEVEKILLTIIDYINKKLSVVHLEAYSFDRKNENYYISAKNNLADLYFLQKKYEKSLKYSLEALEYLDKVHSHFNYEIILKLVAQNYCMLKDYEKAKEYYKKFVYVCYAMGKKELINKTSEFFLSNCDCIFGDEEERKEQKEQHLKKINGNQVIDIDYILEQISQSK